MLLSDHEILVPCGSHPRAGKAKMTELERFLALFTQQVQHTWDTVAHIDHPVWTTVPIDSDANYLGLRVNRITIARSEEQTSELQSLMRKPYAVFCMK